MPALPQLWIVSGPSSVGKSHLLASSRIHEITSLSPGAPVLFPTQLREITELAGDSYLHYNLLRPAWRAVKRGEDASLYNFSGDPSWRAALDLPARRHALILVAGKDTLVTRVRGRTVNELGERRMYQTEQWISLYERIDLVTVYAAWRDELDRQRIPWIELESEVEGFPQLSRST